MSRDDYFQLQFRDWNTWNSSKNYSPQSKDNFLPSAERVEGKKNRSMVRVDSEGAERSIFCCCWQCKGWYSFHVPSSQRHVKKDFSQRPLRLCGEIDRAFIKMEM